MWPILKSSVCGRGMRQVGSRGQGGKCLESWMLGAEGSPFGKASRRDHQGCLLKMNRHHLGREVGREATPQREEGADGSPRS